jgi:hypothetical protein
MKTVKSGNVQIIKAKVFEDYNYLIETDTSTMLVNEQELEDLEKCLFLIKGYEITHQSPTQMFIKKLPPIKDVQKVGNNKEFDFFILKRGDMVFSPLSLRKRFIIN